MQSYFFKLADELTTLLKHDEVYTLYYLGETSDFIRFNSSRVRQAGQVTQNRIYLELIRGRTHVGGGLTLAGLMTADRAPLKALLEKLRRTLEEVPEDPHLAWSSTTENTEFIGENALPSPEVVLEQVAMAGKERDLVGIYAAGAIYRGFANSLGQRNWFANFNFNFDWSFYLEKSKAVKCNYSGPRFEEAMFAKKIAKASDELKVLSRPARALEPGAYRVYLAPSALNEVLTMLAWGGFSLKSRNTAQTPLIKLATGEASFHPSVTLTENIAEGVAANFETYGFIKPPKVTLVEKGQLSDYLVSPRTAREYDVPTNAAAGNEQPVSLDMSPGSLAEQEMLSQLGTGIYVNNLWYLNYSDRRACRITGMTRFATFWVENGERVAPLEAMRFDESAYRMLGSHLLGLTRERTFFLDPDTYGQRATSSRRVPGALVDGMTFTG